MTQPVQSDHARHREQKIAEIRRAARAEAAKVRGAYRALSQRESTSKAGKLIARVAS